jgi:hypothetical protein
VVSRRVPFPVRAPVEDRAPEGLSESPGSALACWQGLFTRRGNYRPYKGAWADEFQQWGSLLHRLAARHKKQRSFWCQGLPECGRLES